MLECPVSIFLEKVKELPQEEKYSACVLLSLFRLLDPIEKKALFSLLANNISVHRIREEYIRKLLLFGIITAENGYYILDSSGRERILLACTAPMEESVLVQTESSKSSAKIGLPVSQYQEIKKTQKEKTKRIEDPAGIYSTMVYKTISNKTDADRTVRKLMMKTKIINNEGLTHKGFNFLLSGKKHQMWTLILAHLQENPETMHSEILTLCELLTKDPKRVYLLDRTNRSKILGLFEALGLLSLEAAGVRFFSSFSLLFGGESEESKFLLLESNFRLYIYSNNPLNVFIVSLFSIKSREFPNMIVSMINEESIRNALEHGITAGQIRSYLNQNCIYEINENVLEQIRLWEKRTRRINSWESYIFSNFLNYKDFLLVESYCSSRKIKCKSYREKRVLIVGVEDYECVKSFIRIHVK